MSTPTETAQAAARSDLLHRAFDWAKWPKLAAIFEHRPRVNVYWTELADFVASLGFRYVEVPDAHMELGLSLMAEERDTARTSLATLQAENAELRERLEAAERATYHERNRADIVARENRKPAQRSLAQVARARATAAEGEAAFLRERLEAAEREADKEHADLVRVADKYRAEKEARAAAEGERDRLRELIGLAAEKIAGKVSAQYPWCEVCGGNLRTGRGHSKACYIGAFAAHLAAIPHAEGEASAPPADEVKRG